MPKPRDLSGVTFGRLTAISHEGWTVRSGTRFRMWRCLCECGQEITVTTGALTTGNTRSCGCLKRDETRQRRRTHGRSATTLYRIWQSMLARCGNPSKACFVDYGGRGISVCARWRESFESFISDMGERPEGYTIERANNNGDYEPGNCVWVPRGVQNRNQRRRIDNASGATGVMRHRTTGKWHAFIGVAGKRLHIGVFDSFEAAAAARKLKAAELGFSPEHGGERHAHR